MLGMSKSPSWAAFILVGLRGRQFLSVLRRFRLGVELSTPCDSPLATMSPESLAMTVHPFTVLIGKSPAPNKAFFPQVFSRSIFSLRYFGQENVAGISCKFILENGPKSEK